MPNFWSIDAGKYFCEIAFHGKKENGDFIVIVNGKYLEISPQALDGFETVRFSVEGKEIELKKPESGNEAELFLEGVLLPPGIGTAGSISSDELNKLARKSRSGMSSFLTFVIFSYINILLSLTGVSIYFPFSAAFPTAMSIFGQGFYDNTGSAFAFGIFLLLGLLAATVYLALYYLAKKKNFAILISAVLIVIDTAFVVFMYIDNIVNGLVDIAFHVWVFISLIQLYAARRRLRKNQPDFQK